VHETDVLEPDLLIVKVFEALAELLLTSPEYVTPIV
jgi:hypothetical protein